MAGHTFQVLMTTGSVKASITFTDSVSSGSFTAASKTFTARNLGTASSSRLIVVGVSTGSGGTISSLTVGGVSATSLVAANNGTEYSELFVAAVPTGTTGDVVVNYSTSTGRETAIGVWAVYSGSATATATGSSTSGNPASAAINIAANGIAVGCTTHRSNTDPTFTWGNLTSGGDYTIPIVTGDTSAGGSSAAFTAAQTALALTSNSSQTGTRAQVMVVASLPHA